MPRRQTKPPQPLKPKPIQPYIQRYKAAVMQRIADHVRLGYIHWTAGAVPADRAQVLVRKFHERYGTGLTRHQKAYGRVQGLASSTLMLWPAPAGGLHWMLLVTPGENLAHVLEQLRDASSLDGRVTLTGYELVQLPRIGNPKPAWTWRMTSQTYEAWRSRLLLAARRGPGFLTDELAQLARTPGFAGNRAQVRKLLQLARAEARRRLGDKARTVAFPAHIGYVQRLSQTGVLLSAWLRNQRCTQLTDGGS